MGLAAAAAAVMMTVPPTAGPASELPATTDMTSAGGTSVSIDGTPSWAQLAGDFAWIATGSVVARLDATTGETLGGTQLSGDVCAGMGRDTDSLWVGTCGVPIVTRVDAATGEVLATIAMDVPTWLRQNSSIAVGEGGVWALSDGNSPLLVEIDPATNTVVHQFPVSVGSAAVQAGLGALWITNCDEEILLRLDPATGTRVATIDVGYYPDALAIGEGSIWVMNEQDGTVSRVDPETNTTIATILVSPDGMDGDIAVAGGYVWVRVNDVLLAQIDPATNEVVGRFGPPAGHGSVAADDGVVWVTGDDPATVWRLPLPLPPS